MGIAGRQSNPAIQSILNFDHSYSINPTIHSTFGLDHLNDIIWEALGLERFKFVYISFRCLTTCNLLSSLLARRSLFCRCFSLMVSRYLHNNKTRTYFFRIYIYFTGRPIKVKIIKELQTLDNIHKQINLTSKCTIHCSHAQC